MVYLLSEQILKQRYLSWLVELVDYESEILERQLVIYIFVKQDLMPFIKKNGYVFLVAERKLAEIIARELFHSLMQASRKTKWHSRSLNTEFRQEDYDHFLHIFDTEQWEYFWEQVSKWIDIEEWNYFTKNIIEHAVWTCIDVENSPQTVIVDEMLGLYDDEEEEPVKEEKRDPYLVEQSSHNEYS
jgi:hypothetical protein